MWLPCWLLFLMILLCSLICCGVCVGKILLMKALKSAALLRRKVRAVCKVFSAAADGAAN
jgi:hypothetical protein